KYSLKNHTSSSGDSFSDIVVNHAISEKKIEIFFLSQLRFTFHSQFNISSAISFETYSDNAFDNFTLFLSSITYLIIKEPIKAKKIDNKKE
ncbi:MAG: hypothetical protein U9Q66_02540, partial [Patescibacteria group bacterium]|nr:hypothetical protein [Patescibacteria group bacterium]